MGNIRAVAQHDPDPSLPDIPVPAFPEGCAEFKFLDFACTGLGQSLFPHLNSAWAFIGGDQVPAVRNDGCWIRCLASARDHNCVDSFTPSVVRNADHGCFKDVGMVGFWSMMVFLAVLTIGFAYEWKKGALEWD